MLAVNVDQRLAKLRQVGHRGEPPVDPATATARRRDFPHHDQCLVGFVQIDAEFLEERAGVSRGRKRRLEEGALLAFSHIASSSSSSKKRRNRVNDDRLAGARLAGKDVESWAKLDLDVACQGEIPDPQHLKQTLSPPARH